MLITLEEPHLLVTKPYVSYFYDAFFTLFEHKFLFISKHISYLASWEPQLFAFLSSWLLPHDSII